MRLPRLSREVSVLSMAFVGILASAPACTPAPQADQQQPRPRAVDAPAEHKANRPKTTAGTGGTGPVSIAGLRVQGNQIVNEDGAAIRLLGFNNAGAEYACIEGWGIFDGPDTLRMSAGAVRAMATWQGANTVRIPLNEQCWLGLGVRREYGGANYQKAIRDYVDLLNANGFVAVLDLHRSAPGNGKSLEQEQMPDRDHSVTFWQQVAAAYKDNISVVFDLFNEPWPYGEVDSSRAWQCWRDGGCVLPSVNTKGSYVAAGMNEIIAAIRGTGARNILLAGGVHWAETLNQWLVYKPDDPLQNLAASFHNYAHNRYCNDLPCYDTVLARVAAAVPLYAGELGPDVEDAKCGGTPVTRPGFSKRILDWLDQHGAAYTPWSWNRWRDCYSLISNHDGTPTPVWGAQIKTRLAANAAGR